MNNPDRLLSLNREHSALFTSEQLRRLQYRGRYPTEVAALKCIDGRVDLPNTTGTPMGIIQPFRNLGGKFDFGWPFFQEVFGQWVKYGIGKGRDCLVLLTYHFSRGEKRRDKSAILERVRMAGHLGKSP